jgi:hypothetical protein
MGGGFFADRPMQPRRGRATSCRCGAFGRLGMMACEKDADPVCFASKMGYAKILVKYNFD